MSVKECSVRIHTARRWQQVAAFHRNPNGINSIRSKLITFLTKKEIPRHFMRENSRKMDENKIKFTLNQLVLLTPTPLNSIQHRHIHIPI